jgi:MFS transporter, DHA1 family, multidrug resistance protein
MKNHSVFLVYALAALAALAPFAIDTYLPAFHVMGVALQATDIQIQQSLTFYLLPYAMMTLFHGAISDSIGRITTIKWGLSVFVLASIGCAFSPNVETLWFFRALQGASGGAGNTVARAMVRDLFEGPQAQRVMATVQMLFGIAPAIAPMIGGILLGIHWQVIFIFLAVYASLSLWAAIRFLPETMPAEKRQALSLKRVFNHYVEMFSNQQFTRLVLCIGLNFSAFFIYVLASPIFLMQHLGLSSQQFAYLFLPTVTGMMIGSWLAKRLAGKYANQAVLKYAYLGMFVSALINVVISATSLSLPTASIWFAILPIALFNIGMATAMPILSIAALDCYPKIRGTAASGQAFIQMSCSTLASALIVPWVWGTRLGLALTMLAILLSSFLVFLPMITRPHHSQ